MKHIYINSSSDKLICGNSNNYITLLYGILPNCTNKWRIFPSCHSSQSFLIFRQCKRLSRKLTEWLSFMISTPREIYPLLDHRIKWMPNNKLTRTFVTMDNRCLRVACYGNRFQKYDTVTIITIIIVGSSRSTQYEHLKSVLNCNWKRS